MRRKYSEIELKTRLMWLTYKLWCHNNGCSEGDLNNYEEFIKEYKNYDK